MADKSQIILYQTADGKTRVEVRFEHENVWLTQKLMAELFETTIANINIHLKNIFQADELKPNSVIKEFLITAAELIAERANSKKPLMGLTNFSGLQMIRRDIYIAKNYLNESELRILNRIVDAYLSFAEIQAKGERAMTMKDWISKLNEYLGLLGKGVLKHAGKVCAEEAEQKANQEYETYRKDQAKNYLSDLDLVVKRLEIEGKTLTKKPKKK